MRAPKNLRHPGACDEAMDLTKWAWSIVAERIAAGTWQVPAEPNTMPGRQREYRRGPRAPPKLSAANLKLGPGASSRPVRLLLDIARRWIRKAWCTATDLRREISRRPALQLMPPVGVERRWNRLSEALRLREPRRRAGRKRSGGPEIPQTLG